MMKEIKREHYENGQIEREVYLLNHKWHREDGPAYIKYCENGEITRKEYWINGEYITDEFQILVIEGLGIK